MYNNGGFLKPFSTQQPNYAGDDNVPNYRPKEKFDKPKQLTLSKMGVNRLSGMGGKNNETRNPRPEDIKVTHEDDLKVKQCIIDDFISTYNQNRLDSQVVNSLILDQFVNVCEIMTHYYDPKYADIVESMNNVLKVMATKAYAQRLATLIKQQTEFSKTFKSNLSELISLTLETRHSVMVDNTKIMYAEIMKDYLFGFEIRELMNNFTLSEDAALDFVIGMPLFGKKLTDLTITRYTERYVEILLNHADTMIDTMTAEMQKKLFYHIFIDTNGITLKAVGKCLCQDLLTIEDDKKNALYTEFIKMLYDILDEHDIPEIRFVLKFIVKMMSIRIELGKETPIVFSTETALERENIKKAILDYAQNSEAAKRYLTATK